MLEQAVEEKNHARVWKIYFYLNNYVRGTVWWKLTPEVREAVEEARKRSNLLKVELESNLDKIRDFYPHLMREHQIAIFQKLPKRMQEEILELEASSRKVKKHLKKVLAGKASGDIIALFNRLAEEDQIEVFPLLPIEVREELV